MKIYEYRIVMPMDLSMYERAHRFATVQFNKSITGGGNGVEIVIQNEPRELKTGDEKPFPRKPVGPVEYSYKVFHLTDQVPRFIRLLAPKGSLECTEESYNGFPHTTTIWSNPYMKDKFYVVTETQCVLNDRGFNDNVFNDSEDDLKDRVVEKINIADVRVDPKDYTEQEDPTKYTSAKAGYGPLTADWIDSADQVMCCYKRFTINFVWFGLQEKVERIISKTIRRYQVNLHRKMFCTTDEWHDMTLADSKRMEEDSREELEKIRNTEPLKAVSME